jgi:hypothetical protein
MFSRTSFSPGVGHDGTYASCLQGFARDLYGRAPEIATRFSAVVALRVALPECDDDFAARPS